MSSAASAGGVWGVSTAQPSPRSGFTDSLCPPLPEADSGPQCPPPCKVEVTLSGADRVRRVTDVTGAGQAGTVTDCTASSPSQGAAALGSSVLSHSIDSVVFEGMSVSWLGVLASGEPRGANRGI